VKVLIDLQHPAHLHFFRPAVIALRDQGHSVLLTGRDKDILVELARLYGLEIQVFGKAGKGVVALGGELLQRQWRLQRIIRDQRPDVMMAIAGTFISSLGYLLRVPTYVFYDTEHATVSNLLAYPFATCVYVPQCYLKPIRWRHERYAGYHELAYLHPKHFTPDPSVLADAGLDRDQGFTIVRFVAWGAAHDIGHSGLSSADKLRVVEQLDRHSRVLISAEGELPPELEPRRLRLPVHRMHHLMHYAQLLFGESGTMPSEAAVMGVPSVYVSPLRLGYLEEQERDYGLVSCYRPERIEAAIERGVEILSHFARDRWRAAGQRLRDDKIDVTQLLVRVATERPHWHD